MRFKFIRQREQEMIETVQIQRLVRGINRERRLLCLFAGAPHDQSNMNWVYRGRPSFFEWEAEMPRC